jgi:Zn-dependent protease
MPQLLERVFMLVPVWLSLSVHEWAHARVAFRLGDDTAARQGRMTLNPLAHIDPIGTLLLPLMGVPFGWARPVPIDPHRFDPKVMSRAAGIALTAAAGPLSNVALSAGAIALLAGIARFSPDAIAGHSLTVQLLYLFALINAALGLFNLFPVVPLDGSRIAAVLVPDALRPAWNAYARIGPLVLLALVLAPTLFGVSVLGWPIAKLRGLLDALVAVPQ